MRTKIRLLACVALPIGLVIAAPSPAKASEEGDWTVVTLARDGLWGAATVSGLGQAIAAAVRNCRAMAAGPSDCGAQFAATRGGWTLGKLCGDQKIVVTGKTLEEAEQASSRREINLRLLYVPNLPPCERVLALSTRGQIQASLKH